MKNMQTKSHLSHVKSVTSRNVEMAVTPLHLIFTDNDNDNEGLGKYLHVHCCQIGDDREL